MRRAGEAQAGRIGIARAFLDPVAVEIGGEADIGAPVARGGEDRQQIGADRRVDPLDRGRGVAVGGDLEDEVSVAAAGADDGVEAQEMGAAAVRVEPVERAR